MGGAKSRLVWGAALLAGLVTVAAEARVEVRCYNGTCLESGWLATEVGTGGWADVRCIDGDCRTRGWRVVDSRGNRIEATCLGEGCFRDGWSEIPNGDRRAAQTHLCQAGDEGPDCLRHGWVSSSPFGRATTVCRDGDCAAAGWVVTTQGRADQVVLCRDKDCFRVGWTLYP